MMKVLGLMGNTMSRTIYLDGESGDEMSESDGEVGTPGDGPMKSPRKTKRRKPKRKTVPAAVGEEPDDDGEYEPSIREEGPEYHDRMDDAPGQDEDDDEPAPSADEDPEVDQPDEDEVGVENVPHEEDDDEDDNDVDDSDPEGGVRLSKRGTLKHEARTLEHLLTHRTKNLYCNACVRAKMKHHKTYRDAFRRKLTKFGDLITFDFMDTRKTTKLGYDTVKEILVIRDRFTGIIQSYPSPTKNTEDVVRAVKYFMGRRAIREAYSDEARHFVKGMEALKIPFDHALPGQFLKDTTYAMVGNKRIPYGEILMKALSHFGMVSVPRDRATQVFMGKRGRQYTVIREEFQLEGNDGSHERFGYRVSKDYGNVFYKDYLKMVLDREFDEIMDYHDAAAEKCGDVVEKKGTCSWTLVLTRANCSLDWKFRSISRLFLSNRGCKQQPGLPNFSGHHCDG